MGLAVIAVGMATFKPSSEGSSASWLKNMWLPVSVFLMYGITNTTINYLNLKYIPEPDKVIPVTLVMIFGALLSGAALLAYRYFRQKEMLEAKSLIAAVTLGIPNFLSFYFLILALTAFGNSGAFVYPIYNMGVILISALTGIFFFRESLSGLNKTGLVLSFLAIILLSHQELFNR